MWLDCLFVLFLVYQMLTKGSPITLMLGAMSLSFFTVSFCLESSPSFQQFGLPRNFPQ